MERLTAKKIAWSSVTGQTVVFHDESGAAVFQASIRLCSVNHDDPRASANRFADYIVDLNRAALKEAEGRNG